MIKQIDRAACKTIREQLNAELVEVGKRLGLTIKAGNASFDASAITFKVECVLEGVDREKEDFDRDCYMFGLPTDAYGKEFNFNGSRWNLRGLKPRSPKFPIIAQKYGQKGQFKLPERAIESLKSA